MKMRTAKNERRRLILDLLQRDEISSQRDLRGRLMGCGVEVNQATLSRDLRDMGVLKVPQSGGGSRYVASPQVKHTPIRHEQVLRQTVIRLERSMNIVVLHTAPGNAPVAALALDSLSPPGILATLAGDDAILVILEDGERMDEIERELRALMNIDKTVS